MRAEPMSCLRPTPERAASFASLPYDVFDRRSAAAYVEAHPDSFLAIDRPETAFPPDQDMYAPEVYAKAAELLRARAQDGTLLRDATPCYYVWRLEQGGHAQTGIACACAVDEYLDGTIRRHEGTTAAKEADRIEHIRATGAQTGPIFLCYRDNYAIDVLVRAATQASPLYDFTDGEGVRQTMWRIARPAAVEALRACFQTVPCAYIADGHHRAASAVHLSLERRRADGRPEGACAKGDERPYDLFLSVLFPASQLRVLPYDRVLFDTAGLTPEDLLRGLDQAGFDLMGEGPSFAVPGARHEFGLFVGGSWHGLRLRDPETLPEGDPVARLDAGILQDRVLGPLLGIDDPRTSERIRFVGGVEGTGRLEELAGAGGAAFSLFPTSVGELMAVSDAGRLMPPKSTWFEPKLRSGLLIRRI
ncbi:DUF1015 domain-containing protein [Olsenella phocaeensis]|uniref:DUF1015 domain-containing protein n=1 Tax=Olsenella phocaeensis TaxID=1852385 RepID=UPI003A9280CA